MESESDSEDMDTLPMQTEEGQTNSPGPYLLPLKSREKYEKRHQMFMTWCKTKKTSNITENLLLQYFSELSKVCNPAYLWTIYSMLKSTIKIENDIDISDFKKLTAFLKSKNIGYKPKKSKTLTNEEIKKFLQEAPDEQYLMKKVVLILGISGACRMDELLRMCIQDIQDKGSILIVTISDFITNKGRVFTVTNSTQDIDYLSYVRKYLSLRPKSTTSSRLFLNYNNEKCTNQVVGKNSFGKIPKEIADYLKLPEPNLYTGHCLRRTSSTLLVSSGMLPLKSREKYEKRYEMFMSWCRVKRTTEISESVLLLYLSELSEVCTPAYLWTIYSMLKSTIKIKHDIDISNFKKLTEFLKSENYGYKPKKSKALTNDEIKKFLEEAPDEQYLMKKVVLILGISGACRMDELVKMCVSDIEDKGSVLVVKIPDSTTNKGRVFTITNSILEDIDYLSYVRKYLSLRPKSATSPRLFLNYKNEKCTNQVVGKNSLGKIPKEIADYLKIPESNLYTGHCLRRISGTQFISSNMLP